MKFLCDNCKAKYQIPDEKIAGRNLRMKCRKCGNEIIIRGPKTAEAPKPRAARRGGSGAVSRPSRPAARSSALGAEFRRGAALAPAAPPKAAAVEWYVAINDVPVGPIKREEVARKIGTGAVTGASLCWREGLGDWQPVSDVPELASLLEQRRVPAPPPPARKAKKKKKKAPAPPPPSNVIPIGGRQGAAPSPLDFDEDEKTIMSTSPFEESAPAAPPAETAKKEAKKDEDDDFAIGAPIEAAAPVAPVAAEPAPEPAAALAAPPAALDPVEPAPKKRQWSIPAIGLLAGCIAFGAVFAFVLAQRMLTEEPAPAVATNTETAEANPVEAEIPIPDEPEVQTPTPEEGEPEGEGAETSEPAEEDPTPSAMVRRNPSRGSMTAMSTGAAMTELTAAQLERIRRLSGGTGDPNVGNISVAMRQGGSMAQALDSAALTRVVRAPANQRAIQRCYNTAIRGNPNPPDVRLNVSIRIAASGRVQSVSASGGSLGTLRQCVEQNVRRWRFPASPDGGSTNFPLVFSAPG